MKALGTTELFHGSTLDPTRLGFVFADEVPLDTRKEAELDENLHRLEMDWIDSCLLVSDIHNAKKLNAQKEGGKWGQRQTASLLGKGYGKSNVGTALRAADLLRKGDKEILACQNLDHALQVMIKRNEDAALAELQRRVTPKAAVMSSPLANTGTSSFLDTLNITLGKPKGEGSSGNIPTAPTVQRSVAAKAVVPLSQMFRLGDFRKLLNPNLPTFQVDHIVTDIPYGIDMENLNAKAVVDVAEQHDVAQNVSQMQDFLQTAFAFTKPGGFCVFFYDLDHHEKLQTWARTAGWKVQRWPLVAVKSSAAQNNAAQYNLTKNYEVAMFLRKDERSVLRHDPKFALNNSSWKVYNFRAEQDLYNNPFAKPFEL